MYLNTTVHLKMIRVINFMLVFFNHNQKIFHKNNNDQSGRCQKLNEISK